MQIAGRRGLAIILAVVVLLGWGTLRSSGVLAAAACSTSTGVFSSVQVCLTAPAPAATLTGATTVSATATVLSGTATVSYLVFTLNGTPILSDMQTPFSWTWHTAHWVDGAYTLGVFARLSDGSDTRLTPASETVTLANGVTASPVNAAQPTITGGSTPAAGKPTVVAGVGDGASGESLSQQVVSQISSWSPNLFLYLGDVYVNGSYEEFSNWYGPSWGTLKAVTDPTIGGYEDTSAGGGYAWYWQNLPLNYSYDTAGWHFISLNGNSPATSASWLNADLAAHPGACVIAYWHQPLYDLGGLGDLDEQAFWTPLANSHATLVLNGHAHNYQRWTGLDASGQPAPTGMVEIVAGTGGHEIAPVSGSDSRVVSSVGNVAGALKLSLTTTSAGFQFIKSDGTVTDSGSLPCQGSGTLAGTVTDAVTGSPIAGATVSYNGTGPAGSRTGVVTTSASGQYTVQNLPVTTYAVTVSAGNYAGRSSSVAVGGGGTTTQDYMLQGNPGTITGTVTDATTAQPVAGATVSYSAGNATSDASGHYTLASVAEGTYAVTASAAGHGSASATVTVAAGGAATQSFALPPSPGSITGTVTDATSSLAISGATVSYSGGTTSTDAAGHYTLSSVPVGTYQVTATATGYVAQSQPVTVSTGATTTQNFALARAGTITGTVSDAGTSQAISGATVAYSGGSTTTDAAGHYTLSGLAAGTYTVTAAASAHVSQNQTVTVSAGGATTQNFALAASPGAITGAVTDNGSGQPLGGATVSYSGGSTTADAAGHYTLSAVAAGTYTVTATASGHVSQNQTVTVSAGATTTQNFALMVTPVFSDGFESGTMSSWTSSTGLRVQTTIVHSGTYAAEGSTTSGNTYAFKLLASTYSELYARIYLQIKSQSSGFTVVGDQTASGTGIVRLYISPQSQLVLWNDVTNLTITGPTLSLGSWHSLELHVIVNGASSTTDVWLDGSPVAGMSSQSAMLGAIPVGQLQLGSQASTGTYDTVFDDVAAATGRIGP